MRHNASACGLDIDPNINVKIAGLVDKFEVKPEQPKVLEGRSVAPVVPPIDEYFVKLSDISLEPKKPDDSQRHLLLNQVRGTTRIDNLLGCHSQIKVGNNLEKNDSFIDIQPKNKLPKVGLSLKVGPNKGGLPCGGLNFKGTTQPDKHFNRGMAKEDPLKVKGKVKKLVTEFEWRKKENEGSNKKDKTRKEKGIMKTRKRKPTNSVSSPAFKKSLKMKKYLSF